jgi:hypothetical protein
VPVVVLGIVDSDHKVRRLGSIDSELEARVPAPVSGDAPRRAGVGAVGERPTQRGAVGARPVVDAGPGTPPEPPLHAMFEIVHHRKVATRTPPRQRLGDGRERSDGDQERGGRPEQNTQASALRPECRRDGDARTGAEQISDDVLPVRVAGGGDLSGFSE